MQTSLSLVVNNSSSSWSLSHRVKNEQKHMKFNNNFTNYCKQVLNAQAIFQCILAGAQVLKMEFELEISQPSYSRKKLFPMTVRAGTSSSVSLTMCAYSLGTRRERCVPSCIICSCIQPWFVGMTFLLVAEALIKRDALSSVVCASVEIIIARTFGNAAASR